MAVRTRYAGSGLGLKPISIGEEPYRADSDFDSTVRIPTLQKRVSMPNQAAEIAPPQPSFQPAPIAPQQPPAQPQVQQPVQPPATQPSIPPPSIAQPPIQYGLDPTQLNYEGSTFKPTVAPTTTTTAADQPAVSGLLDQLEGFSGLKLPANWREMSPEALLAEAKRIVDTAKQYGTTGGNKPDTSFRTRLDDWYKKLEGAIRSTSSPNAEYQIQYRQQEFFNQGIERLKLAGASGAREQDEELLAMLASRGLLDSGIAAREIGRLQEARNRNLYEAANALNQMILQGDISRLTARDLATLEADLQKRNSEALLRLQQKFAEANQPNGLAQILGTAAGTALPFLLSPKAPSKGSTLYGEEDPGYRNA